MHLSRQTCLTIFAVCPGTVFTLSCCCSSICFWVFSSSCNNVFLKNKGGWLQRWWWGDHKVQAIPRRSWHDWNRPHSPHLYLATGWLWGQCEQLTHTMSNHWTTNLKCCRQSCYSRNHPPLNSIVLCNRTTVRLVTKKPSQQSLF